MRKRVLNETTVREIKWVLNNMPFITTKRLAEVHMVSEQTIIDIKKGKTWKDVKSSLIPE